MIEVKPSENVAGARIIVAGIGGSGGNAIDRMVAEGVKRVEFIGINTDMQALAKCQAPKVIQIGEKLTKGLGAGSKPEVGEKAAEENIEEIQQALKGADMVFVTCGMGGGTGTGAAPVVAKIAKDMGILTIAVVTKPFPFEGKPRMQHANEGISKIRECVDTIIVIPNEKILEIMDRKTTFPDALKKADEVLQQSVQGITDIINESAMINLDYSDLCTAMKDSGVAYVGIGIGKGEDKASDAVKMAVESPLLDTSISGAKKLVLSVSGDIGIYDVQVAAEYVQELAGENVDVIFGADYDVTVPDTCKVTVIATGIEDVSLPTRATSNPGFMFSNGVVKPQPLPNFGMRQQAPATGAAPELSVLQNRSTNSMPKINVPTPPQGYSPSITSPGDIRSKQSTGSLDIPQFLRKN